MGTPWCDKLATVCVAMTSQPKPVTIVLPFYENSVFLRRQIAWWHTYPAHVRQQLNAIIVDDCSPTPAEGVLAKVEQPFPIRLFRIEQDVRWNWLAARNIGFHNAQDGWCLVTDMDHVIPATTAEACVYGRHYQDTIYGFSRIEHTGEKLLPHPNSWFITRQMFWNVGGYDETLSGHYGTDGDWRRRCAATATMEILNERLIRHEYVEDSSTVRYLRKQPVDAAVKRIVSERKPGWRPKSLSFPYHEVKLPAAVGV